MTEFKSEPRVLVISNECISNSSSNGRTIRNFLIGYPLNLLSQFYIQGGAEPDFSVCRNYYRVTDSDVVRSLFGKNTGGTIAEIEKSEKTIHEQTAKRHNIPRNSVTMLIRDVIWNLGIWRNKHFIDWLDSVNPECILFQAGDCPFLIKLVLWVSKRYDASIVIYNSESYCLKTQDYFDESGIEKIFFPLFFSSLKKQYKRLMPSVFASVYNTDKLKNDSDLVLGGKSEVLYTSSDLKLLGSDGEEKILYAGNLGLNRHKALLEIAESIKKVSPEAKIDVYGSAEEDVVKELNESENIIFHGRVSYDVIKREIEDSFLLLHMEYNDVKLNEDLRYAFSTKIADCLASGHCFLIYAPEQLACTDYLKRNNACWVATNKSELDSSINDIFNGKEKNRYINSALELAFKNHNCDSNKIKFQQILIDSVKR